MYTEVCASPDCETVRDALVEEGFSYVGSIPHLYGLEVGAICLVMNP
jgi:hypothetical protein